MFINLITINLVFICKITNGWDMEMHFKYTTNIAKYDFIGK